MNQNRSGRQSEPNRSSDMEQAEGSRDTARANERMSGSESVRNSGSSGGSGSSSRDRDRSSGGSSRSSESMRNRESESESPSQDLGSSSDRAMFTERGSAEGRSGPSERGTGSSDERNMGSSDRTSSNSGGITNRELSREQSEQEQLPERGRSQSER
jgi:hypothetical protein